MKIFISWSGKPSQAVALALRDWLPLVFQDIKTFVSSDDIRKGKRWPLEVSKQLDTSNFGIVCLTQENLSAEWILFEAGALSKSVKNASLFTLLTGGLRTSDIEGPLSHFQHTTFEKNDFLKLVLSINDANSKAKQDPARLSKVFEAFWKELETNVEKALKAHSAPEKRRSVEDMLRELLDITTQIARNTPAIKMVSGEDDSYGMSEKVYQDTLWEMLKTTLAKENPVVNMYLMKAVGGRISDDRKSYTIYFSIAQKDSNTLINSPNFIQRIADKLSSLGFTECNHVDYQYLIPSRKLVNLRRNKNPPPE